MANSAKIVCGVDGSQPSVVALEWALRQAKLTGSPLEVVTAWDYPTNYGWAIPLPDDIDFKADAATLLDQTVNKVLGAGDNASVTVEKTVVHGHAALALTDLAKDASLLVVGSRGHGQFAGMLLGSVSEYLATHSPCPVLIVHEATANDKPDEH